MDDPFDDVLADEAEYAECIRWTRKIMDVEEDWRQLGIDAHIIIPRDAGSIELKAFYERLNPPPSRH